MNRKRAKDVAFGVSAACSIIVIGAVILSAFFTVQTFVTQYSVLAGRSAYVVSGR